MFNGNVTRHNRCPCGLPDCLVLETDIYYSDSSFYALRLHFNSTATVFKMIYTLRFVCTLLDPISTAKLNRTPGGRVACRPYPYWLRSDKIVLLSRWVCYLRSRKFGKIGRIAAARGTANAPADGITRACRIGPGKTRYTPPCMLLLFVSRQVARSVGSG